MRQGGRTAAAAGRDAFLVSLAVLAGGHVVMRGISQTSRMVRWCACTSAYRVVGAPERRLAKTPLDRHLGRRGARVRTAAKEAPRRTIPATPATPSRRATSLRPPAVEVERTPPHRL